MKDNTLQKRNGFPEKESSQVFVIHLEEVN
jgi:hypothetical protein